MIVSSQGSIPSLLMLLKPPVEAWTSSYLLDPVHVPEDPPKQYPPKQIQVLHAAQVAHSALLLHPENDVTVLRFVSPPWKAFPDHTAPVDTPF